MSQDSRLMISIGNFLFKYRNTVFLLVDLVLILCTRPRFIFGSVFLDNCMDVVGFAIALSGQALRALVIGLEYIKRGGRDKKIAADKLVQGGIFAHSRNPLYLGNILILIGLGVIYNSIWVYVFGFSFFIFGYLAIVMAEETFLKAKFGAEYEDYCRRVPRFIPQFTGIQETVRSGAFNWIRFIKKEYNLICIWVGSAIFLVGWEELYHFGYAARKTTILALSLCLIPILVFYCTVRYLKKHKILGAPD